MNREILEDLIEEYANAHEDAVSEMNTSLSWARFIEAGNNLACYLDKMELDNNTLRAHIAELESERRWIPVSEGLPEKNFDEDWKSYDTVVQHVEQKPFLTICHYQDGKWFENDEDYSDITKWVTYWRKRPDFAELPVSEVQE